MTSTTRRNFLKQTAASIALIAGVRPLLLCKQVVAESASRELLMLNNTDVDVSNRDLPTTVTNPGSLKWLDVKTGQDFAIALPFFGHTSAQNPAKRNQFATFEKWGKRGAVVDIEKQSIVKMAESSGEHVFFGHSSYSKDGNVIVVSEETYSRDAGKLVVRDSSDLKTIRTLSSHGICPHDNRFLQDGKTLVVANAGQQDVTSTLCWIDFESGSLLHKVDFGNNVPGHFASPLFGDFAHFDISYDGWVCVGGAGRKKKVANEAQDRFGVLAFISPQGKAYYPDLPTELTSAMHGECLSLAVLGQTGLVAVTVFPANMCMIFDYKTQALVETIYLAHCRGVVPTIKDANYDNGIILTTTQGLVQINSPYPDHKISTYNPNFKGIGSHLARHYA